MSLATPIHRPHGLARRTTRLALLLTVLAGAPLAWADSDLDPTFSPPGGYTVTQVGTEALANAVVIDSHGRVLVAGQSYPNSSTPAQFTVLRYHGDDDLNNSGFIDLAYNGTGIATATVGIDGANAYAAVLGPNDSVVVAGDCTIPTMPQNHAFCLARFTSSGVLDTSFGSGGTVVTRVGPDDAYAKAITRDSAGNYLVAGYSSSFITGNPVFTVVRYSPSGVADSSFGFAGYASAAETSGGSASASAIALDGNGAIVVAGGISSMTYPNGAFAVTRFLTSGTPDSSFNGGALALAAFSNGGSASSVAIDAQNRPVLAGSGLPASASTSVMALARFTAAGLADTSFGTGGVSANELNGCTEAGANGIRIDTTGRFFIAGVCRTTQPMLALVHYNNNGSLDAAFANGGYDVERFGVYASASAVALDTHGRPVVVGSRLATRDEFVINRHDYIFSHGFD